MSLAISSALDATGLPVSGPQYQGYSLNRAIDEFAIYDTVLPAARVDAHYAAASTAYGCEAAGQLISQAPSNGSATTYAYDSLGRRATATTAGMVTTFRYDDAGELCWMVTGATMNTNTCGSPPAGASVYAYDPAGRVVSSTGSGTTTSYGYDRAGRLQTLHLVAGAYDITRARAYSPGGDVVSAINSGASTSSSSFGWDDAAGLPTLASLTTGGASTDLVSGAGQWAAAYTIGGGLAGIGLDSLGNVIPTTATRNMVTSSTYDAWGTPAGSDGPSLEPGLGYGGQLQFGDTVDLRARNYDTTLGAFTTVDLLDGQNGGTTVAALYPYADNNPIGMTDPSGEQATDDNAFIWPGGGGLENAGMRVGDATGGSAQDYYQLSQPVSAHLAKTTISAGSGLTYETAHLAAVRAYYSGNFGSSSLNLGCATDKRYLSDCAPRSAIAFNVFIGDLCSQPGIRCSGYSGNEFTAGLSAIAPGMLLGRDGPSGGETTPGEGSLMDGMRGAGDEFATGVELGGRPDGETVLAGHGAYVWASGDTVVPAGTTVYVYSKFGQTVSDSVGRSIEQGSGPAPTNIYKPGDEMPNDTLLPSTGLTVMSDSDTVSAPTLLSNLLEPGMGTAHWATCTLAVMP